MSMEMEFLMRSGRCSRLAKIRNNVINAESNNWNERDGNQQNAMDLQGKMENENKTLGTERSENINSLYVNKYKTFVQN